MFVLQIRFLLCSEKRTPTNIGLACEALSVLKYRAAGDFAIEFVSELIVYVICSTSFCIAFVCVICYYFKWLNSVVL